MIPLPSSSTCRDPETGKPFVLSDAERQFLQLAFTLNENGRLYPEMVFGAIKKSGKTTLAAIIMLTMILLYGGRFAEGYCVANDLEQAQSRVFAISSASSRLALLRAIANPMRDRVTFPALDASIIAIASDAASAAGANPVITRFDELWGFTIERTRRLWDEMIPPYAQDRMPSHGVVRGLQRRESCCWRKSTSAAWRCPRSRPSCMPATAC